MKTLHLDCTASSRVWRSITLLACFGLVAGPVQATQAFGFNSQTFRGRVTDNVSVHQWIPTPLFTLLMQSSRDQWGIDVVQGTSMFAPMDASGRPSQSGWHDHPTLLTIGLIVEGQLWSHEKANPECLKVLPTGTVFFERRGEIHNNYNLDPKVTAVVRVIHFIERNESATRRDQPDPVTGNPTTAGAPPPACPEGVATSGFNPWDMASPSQR
jgi:hypothetical protein